MRSTKIIGSLILTVVALSILTAIPAAQGLTLPNGSATFEGTLTLKYSHVLRTSINATIRLFSKLNISADSPAWRKLKSINASVEVIKNYEEAGNYTAAFTEFKKALNELHQLVKSVIAEYVQKGKAALRAGLAGVLAEAQALNITANHLLKAIKSAEDKGLINSTKAEELMTEVKAQIKVLNNVTEEVNATVSTGGIIGVNLTAYKKELKGVVHSLNSIRFELNKAATRQVGTKVSSALKLMINKLLSEVTKLRSEAKKLRAEGNNESAHKLVSLADNITKLMDSVKANLTLTGNMTELLRTLRSMEAYVFALRGLSVKIKMELSILPRIHNATLELHALKDEGSHLRELAHKIRVLVNECVNEANKTSTQSLGGWGLGGSNQNGTTKICSDCRLMLNLSVSIENEIDEITNLSSIEINTSFKEKGQALSQLIILMNEKKDKIYTQITELRNLVIKDCTLVDPNATKTIIVGLQVLSIKLHMFEVDLKRIEATLNITAINKASKNSEAAEGLINASIKILRSIQKQLIISNCSTKALGYVNDSISYLLKAQNSLKNNQSAKALGYVNNSISLLKTALNIVQGNCLQIREFSISVKIEVSIHLLLMVENTLS